MKASLLSLLLLTATLFSCTKNNDDAGGTVNQSSVSGSWRVSQFTDSGKDETGKFSGYNFVFTDGVVTALKGSSSQAGTWSVNNSSHKFIINLGDKSDANKPLGELTDDWKILSSSATEIRLGDDNAASNELLTFTKN